MSRSRSAPARRRCAAAVGAFALTMLAGGCGGDANESARPAVEPTPPAVTFLRAEQWPPGLGPWREVSPVQLDPDAALDEGALVRLICGDVEFPAGTGVRGYATAGYDRAQDPTGHEAAADQYVSTLADDAAATEQIAVLIREFRGCSDDIGEESFQEYPKLDVADGVRIYGRFVVFPDGRTSAKLFAFGRAGRVVSIEALHTADGRSAVPRTEFETTARAAMEQLTS